MSDLRIDRIVKLLDFVGDKSLVLVQLFTVNEVKVLKKRCGVRNEKETETAPELMH